MSTDTTTADTTAEPAADPAEARRLERRRQLLRIAGLVAYCGYVIVLSDLATGGYLCREIGHRLDHARRSRQRRPIEIPAASISALHAEARKITEEAAARW